MWLSSAASVPARCACAAQSIPTSRSALGSAASTAATAAADSSSAASSGRTGSARSAAARARDASSKLSRACSCSSRRRTACANRRMRSAASPARRARSRACSSAPAAASAAVAAAAGMLVQRRRRPRRAEQSRCGRRQARELVLLGRRQPGGGARTGHAAAQALGRAVEIAGHLATAAVEFVGDPVVELGAEQLGQQRPPLVVVGAQEPRELALRQQHDLGELVAGQAEVVGEHLADLVLACGSADPAPALEALEVHLRALEGRALATSFGTRVLRRASDALANAPQRELQRHLGLDADGSEMRVQPSPSPALAGAVERKGDRIEHRRLPRAGGPVEQEQPARAERFEVDALLAGERAERAQPQPMQPHAVSASPVEPLRRRRRVRRAGADRAGSSRPTRRTASRPRPDHCAAASARDRRLRIPLRRRAGSRARACAASARATAPSAPTVATGR